MRSQANFQDAGKGNLSLPFTFMNSSDFENLIPRPNSLLQKKNPCLQKKIF